MMCPYCGEIHLQQISEHEFVHKLLRHKILPGWYPSYLVLFLILTSKVVVQPTFPVIYHSPFLPDMYSCDSFKHHLSYEL